MIGYYLDNSSGSWKELHCSSPFITGEVNLQIASWSHESVFAQQEVSVTFDNSKNGLSYLVNTNNNWITQYYETVLVNEANKTV